MECVLPFPLWIASVHSRSVTVWEVQEVSGPLQVVQSLAVLEVVHACIGIVRSPVHTVAQQVASRLFIVWGILFAAPEAAAEGSLPLLTCAPPCRTVPHGTSVARYVRIMPMCARCGVHQVLMLWLVGAEWGPCRFPWTCTPCCWHGESQSLSGTRSTP